MSEDTTPAVDHDVPTQPALEAEDVTLSPATTTTATATAATTDEESDDSDLPPLRRSFREMGLKPEILQALEDMGFETPMDVQDVVFDQFVAGHDLMVQARTGTGKTAAFGIPITTKLDWSSKGLQALILAPTRELALQVAREMDAISTHTDLRVVPVYGGAPMKPQVDALAAGAQVVAGTPGRVLDHLRRGTMKPGNLSMLVLDECDEMLSMGFQEEIENIISFLPDRDHRQTLLFSATIPDEIQRIARRHMTEPVQISLSDGGISVDEIDHFYYVVSGMARTRDLLRVLKAERPESALIFCNTREDTNTVAKFLCRNGYDAEAISSDLTQRDRERVMKRMRDKTLPFLVATDVAARGIDISDLTHVINYTFPESAEVYVHRTGRTGRAGKSGVALSLVGPREIGSFYYLKLIYKIRPKERDLPSMEELATMEEGYRYEEVVELVPEQPPTEYLSLARRLWQSNEGERVVAALLQRLLDRKPAPAIKLAPVAATETETAMPQKAAPLSSPSPSPASPSPSSSPSVGESSPVDEPARRQDSIVTEEPRPRHRRSRRSRTDGARAPSEGVAEAVSDDTAPVEPLSGEDETVDGVDRKRKRRRRRRGSGSEGTGPRGRTSATAAKPNDEWEETMPTTEGDAREFWEAWADHKNPLAAATAIKPAPAAIKPAPAAKPASTASRPPAEASDEQDEPGLVRLYVNLGKREDITADDLRAAIVEWLDEDPGDNLGRITLRNTHCYVRVDESIADKVIETANGKLYKEREVVVERARNS